MVLFDATALSLLLHRGAKPPSDSKGVPIPQAHERIELLVKTLDESKTKIVIPTPALAELLIIAGDAGPQYLDELNNRSCFKIVHFDERATIESSIQERKAREKGDKKQGSEGTWAKVKFDRQIVAIAKVEGVTTIYSDDADVRKFAKDAGIEAIGTEDLPLPQAQQKYDLFEGQPTQKINILEPPIDSMET